MQAYILIPFLNPIKFVIATDSPGKHFDDDWFYNQILSFQTKIKYEYKWQRNDTTPIQVRATLLPEDLKVYGCDGKVKKSIPFTKTADGGTIGYNIYEAVVNIDELPNSTYYYYINADALGTEIPFISEPISLKDFHPNTSWIQYKHRDNRWFVTFTTGLQFGFRAEAKIMDFQPEGDSVSFIDQVRNETILSATPYRSFKLFVGDAKGVAPYIADILNRIMYCSNVLIDGKQFVRNGNAKFEVTRVKNVPTIGLALEVLEGQNLFGLQQTVNPAFSGMLATFNHEADFFGTSTPPVRITNVS